MAALALLAVPVGAETDSSSSHDEGGVQSDYLAIYLKLNDTAELEAKGDLNGALAGFEDCYTRLAKIHKNYPRWEEALVDKRLEDCQARIIEIEGRLAAMQKKPAAAVSAAPATGTVESPAARLAELEQKVKASPNDPSAYRDLGVACLQCGQVTEAIDAFKHSIVLDPGNVYAHNFLGCAQMRKGRVEAAAKEFRAALTLDEGLTEAHYNLAILYATEDPPALITARAHYKRALELGLIPDPHLAKILHVAQD
jgi:tetratricopeptide (TPR) repeat protein